MSIWILKALVQKGISFLPFKHQFNFLFQKYVTKGVILSESLFEDKLIHCSNHIKYFEKYSKGTQNYTSLEIGTGWYPIVPIGLYLSGAGKIHTIDISSLLSSKSIVDTIQKYEEWSNGGKIENTKLNQYIQKPLQGRLSKLISLKDTAKDTAPIDFLKLLDIHAIVGDARHIALPDKSIDLINSNNTFEHIYPSILIDILREFKRLLSANGVMTHQIDMSDHFAHLDKSITIYNFLQFTDKQWEWIDNSIQPQNRLRLSEYQKIYQQVGLTINETYNREGNLELLRSVKLSDNYKDFDEKDLAVSHSLLISKN
jgi:hypothetical protein